MSRKKDEEPLEAISDKAQRSRDIYDDEIAKHGKVLRIEEWVNSSTPILHRCLTHGEIHTAFPSNLKRGRGLKCCQQASKLEVAAQKSKNAAARYDERIAEFGKVKSLENYVKKQRQNPP